VAVKPTRAQQRQWKTLPDAWRLAIRALLGHFADLSELVEAARQDGEQSEYTIHSLMVGPGALDEEFVVKLDELLALIMGGIHALGRQVMRSHGPTAALMAQELRCEAVDKHVRRLSQTERPVEKFIAEELLLWLASTGISFILRDGQVSRKLPSLTLDQEIAELELTSRQWQEGCKSVEVLNYHLMGRRLRRDLPPGSLSEEHQALSAERFETYRDVDLVLPAEWYRSWPVGLAIDEHTFRAELSLRARQSPLSLLDGRVEYGGLVVMFSLSRLTGELCPLGFSAFSLRGIFPPEFHDALRFALLETLHERFEAGEIEEALDWPPSSGEPDGGAPLTLEGPPLPTDAPAQQGESATIEAPAKTNSETADGALRLPWVKPKQMRRALARAGAVIRPGGRHFKAFFGEHSTAIYGVHSADKLLSPPQQREILAALRLPIEKYAGCLRGRLLRLIKRGS